MDSETVKDNLRRASHDGKITCAQCFAVADELGISVEGFAKILDDLEIRIINCQMGCF